MADTAYPPSPSPARSPAAAPPAAVPWRWLRLALLIASLVCAGAAQYWLSVHPLPVRSAVAWAAALACFVSVYVLGREARALPRAGERVGGRELEWVWLAVVLAIGVFFTIFRLRAFPPGLNHDAAFEGLYGIRILHGLPYTPYTPEAWGRETFTFYLRALSIWLLGPTRLAVTLPSTVAGVLILPFFFVWARQMFGSRFALLATLFLGVSGWHLVFSRTGWRSDFQPLFMTVTCCFFMRGMLDGRALDFALSGIALALTLNTYNGARLFPLLFPLWLAAVVWASWHWRGFLRHYGRGLLAMAAAFAVAIAPLAWYALHHWDVFQGRAHALAGAVSPRQALQATALLFNYRGNGDDFFVNTPALEYPTAIFLAFGLLWGLLHWRDERMQFLLLGLVLNIVPGLVSKPNMNRDIGTMPFIYFFVGLGALFFAVQARALLARIGRTLAPAILILAGGAAMQATFAQYLSHDRRAVWGYYPETTVLGNYIKTLVPEYAIWVGGANFPRDALTYLSYTGQPDPMQRNYTWLDDVTVLSRMRPAVPAGKGLAFVLANEGPSLRVIQQLQRRYPRHRMTEIRYPADNGQVFANALLVSPEATATGSATAPDIETAPAVEPVESQLPPATLRQPRGVAVTGDGQVVVCDFGNNRIQELGRDLRPIRQWGGAGNAPGQLNQPGAVAVGPAGQIFVADTWNQRVQVFSPEGKFIRAWPANAYGPRGIAVDAGGTVFVSDTGGNRILRFSPSGQQEKEWGSKGTEPGRFVEPVGLTVDGNGQVYVCDNGNGRLQIFDRDGTFVSQFPVAGWESKVYSEPHVTLDPRGNLWVTVPGAQEVRSYDRTGKLLRTIKGEGSTFDIPMGIAYDRNAHELIVTDLNDRVVRIADLLLGPPPAQATAAPTPAKKGRAGRK
ncbi:MAG: glycosyltransferase family 39 protein [Candidatus Binatia bacterium]